nr:hypothetical protein CFP56_56463 [Quercus suber]
MKFSGLITILSFSAAASSAIVARDAPTLLRDINSIGVQLNKTLADINAFNGGTNGVNQALAIYTDSNNLDAVIKNSTADAKASAVLNDADSASIALAVTSLQSNIYATLDALVAKHYDFTAASLGFNATGLVHDTLVSMRTDTNNFGGNVTAKLSAVLSKSAPLITSDIDYHFVRAIQAFAQ